MNNPFSRLKHHLPDKIDPQENHATECLAACLVFSSRIREAFVEFLFDSTKPPIRSYARIEIVTQQPITFGYVDLVLSQESEFALAVEVKVKSPENCSHHRDQLEKYKKWLGEQCKTNFLFTLVRNADSSFYPEQYGANGRRTWLALHKRFQMMLRANVLSDVESSLIKNFCDYLESEAIVSTYETKDLLSYAAGLKARKAVTGIFNQIASRLEVNEFQTVSVEERKGHWPQLRIQHPRWKEIFGDSEKNWKVCLWFCIPGIWDAPEHKFYPEIELWHEDHENEWSSVISKLPNWFSILKSHNFTWTVYQTWNKSRENSSATEIQIEPKRIVAWKPKSEDDITLDQNQFKSEDDLVNSLVDRINQYSEIVALLGR